MEYRPLETSPEELMPIELLDESVDIIDWGRTKKKTT